MIHPILNDVFIISLSCSGIALLLLAVRKLIGKNTGAWWRSMLWVLLLIRLSIPVMIESPIGVVDSDLDTAVVNHIYRTESDSSININNTEIDTYLVDSEEVTEIEQPLQNNTSVNNQMNNPNSFSWLSLVDEVYLFGLIASILVLFIRNIILNNKVKSMKICTDKKVMDTFAQVKKRLGIRHRLLIVIEDKDSVPALYGILAPVIIIPQSALVPSRAAELEYILIHELTHYKQGDIAKLWILELVTCIHWFNPLLHLIKPVIVQDIELACDEKVLSKIHSTEYAYYGNVLVNCSTRNKSKHPLVVTSNFAGKRGNKLKERLVMIKKFNRPRIITIGMILLLTISIILVACSTAVSKDRLKFDNSNVGIVYSGETESIIEAEYNDLLIEQLNTESQREVGLDSIDITEKNDFVYTIYEGDKTYEMFRMDCIYDQIYVLKADNETGEQKLYYYNSAVLGDLMDEIEGEYIKQNEITRYDDMLLDIVCNLIDGETTIESVVSNEEWEYKGTGFHSTKMYLYSHISVIFSIKAGDDNLDRALDYSKDTLVVDYVEKDSERINPTSEELMEYIFDASGTPLAENDDDPVEELSKIELIQKLNLSKLGNFSCGLAAARTDDGLWGFINENGIWAIEPIYNMVYDFSENIARVGLASDEILQEIEANRQEYEGEFADMADQWGYINTDDEIIADIKYEQANDFENGYGFIWDRQTGIGAYIDNKGDIVLSSEQLPSELEGFGMGQNVGSDGTIILEKVVDEDGWYIHYQSIIDINGNVLLNGEELNLSYISQSINEYRVVKTNDKISGSSDTGVINNQNEWVINPIYDEIEFISEEKLILTKVMDNRAGLESGIYNIATQQWLIEPDGKYIFDYGYDMMVLYTMEEPQKMELYNTDNQILLGGKSYQSIQILGNDLIKTKENDSTPYMLTWSDGTRFISEYETQNAQYLTDNIIAVYIYDYEEGAYHVGLIDNTNRTEWLLEPKYNRLLSFDGNVGEGIIINPEESDDRRVENGKIVFDIEEFDLDGNTTLIRQDVTMDYESFQDFCPFYLK